MERITPQWTDTIPYRALAILIPVIAISLHFGIMLLTLPWIQFELMAGLIVAYLLPPAGKETVIPLGISLGIPWWYMALSITMVDVEMALIMLLNFDLVYRIPFVGKLLTNLTTKTGEFLAHHRWLAGLYFFGIILMVMVPILGSGGVRGSIAGRLLGMEPRRIFLAILAGAIIGCFAIAVSSSYILDAVICPGNLLPVSVFEFVCNRTAP
jgi:uncharacterized membrane protein